MKKLLLGLGSMTVLVVPVVTVVACGSGDQSNIYDSYADQFMAATRTGYGTNTITIALPKWSDDRSKTDIGTNQINMNETVKSFVPPKKEGNVDDTAQINVHNNVATRTIDFGNGVAQEHANHYELRITLSTGTWDQSNAEQTRYINNVINSLHGIL